MGEVLPYLEVTKDGITEEEYVTEIVVPNIEGKTLKEAENILKDTNLEIVINNEQEDIDKENTVVKEQTPKEGVKVIEGISVYIDW